MIINQVASGGGAEIIGTTADYSAIADISAGEFVEYVSGGDSQITGNDAIYKQVSKITDTKYFAIYQSGVNVMGCIITIDGTTVTQSTAKTLFNCQSTSNVNKKMVCVPSDGDNSSNDYKYFIGYAYGDDTLYAALGSFDLSSDSVYESSVVKVDSTSYSGMYSNVSFLYFDPTGGSYGMGENRFLMCCKGSANRMYVYVIGDDFGSPVIRATYNSEISVGSYSPLLNYISDNKVFCAYPVSSNSLNGCIFTVNSSGTTISLYSNKTISTRSYSGGEYKRSVALDSNRVFVLIYSGYGLICTINGTTLTVGSETYIPDITDNGFNLNITSYTNGDVYIACAGGQYSSPYSVLRGKKILTVGTTITPQDTVTLLNQDYTGQTVFPFVINNSVIVVHNNTSRNQMNVFFDIKGVKPYQSNIFGVALTSGTTGEQVSVVTPTTT